MSERYDSFFNYHIITIDNNNIFTYKSKVFVKILYNNL